MESQEVVSSHVLELHQLISAPLIATIDADTMVSKRYFDFLTEVAFENDQNEGSHLGSLRNITFNYDQNDVNGSVPKQVTIPVLSLIPLPLLQIKDAEFDFDIKIVDAVSDVSQQKNYQFNQEDNQNATPDKNANNLKLRASLAPKTGSSNAKSATQTLTANMHIKINMQQADIPGGLSNLLQLTASNMNVKNKKDF